jgi:hypothetical protein
MDKDPPSLSTLSPSVLTQFNALGGGQRGLFKTVFNALWRYLWPISKVDPVLLSYALPAALDGLKLRQWVVLARLFMLTTAGSHAIDSRRCRFTGTEENIIPDLMRLGYIQRTSFDPASPHLIASRAIQKVYISFTPLGIRYVRGVLDRVNRGVRDDLAAYHHPKRQRGPD